MTPKLDAAAGRIELANTAARRGAAPQAILLVLSCVALALWVHRRSLGAAFTPDDFIFLERARGLLPQRPTWWRFLAGDGYFRAMLHLVGLRPFPGHFVSWESNAPLPLLLLLPAAGPSQRTRMFRAASLLALSGAWTIYLVVSSARSRVFSGGAYDVGFGANLFGNLMTLAEWSVDTTQPIPDLFSAISATAWRTGMWVVAALALLSALSWRRTRLPAQGSLLWLLGLLPVLPLLYHTYLHYLYLPCAGFAMAAGGTLEWALGAAPPATRAAGARPGIGRIRALGWPIAAAAILAHAAAANRLLEERRQARLEAMDLPLDPFLRKCVLAGRIREGVGEVVARGPTRIAFLEPPGEAKAFNDVLRGVMDEGRALRLFFPALDSVAYLAGWDPAYRDFELLAQDSEGRVRDLGRGPDAHLAWAALLEQNQLGSAARDHLAAALRTWPDDRGLRLGYAQALLRLGEIGPSRRELETVAMGAAGDSLTLRARALLGWIDKHTP